MWCVVVIIVCLGQNLLSLSRTLTLCFVSFLMLRFGSFVTFEHICRSVIGIA